MLAHRIHEEIASRRIAQLELLDEVEIDAAAIEIIQSHLSLCCVQKTELIEATCLIKGLFQLRFRRTLRPIDAFGLFELHPKTLSQRLDRFGKSHLEMRHQKRNGIPVSSTPKAMIMAIALLDRKRRGLFLMKWTKRLKGDPGALELHIGRQHLDKIDARSELL